MQRRQFLSLTVGALALAVAPASVRAEDYRKLKPAVWSAHKMDVAIKAMYGTTATIEEGVKLKAANVAFDSGKMATAANGGAIPLDFSTKIPAKTIAVFQDANPEAAVCVYTVGKYDMTTYSIKIKMGNPGSVKVIVEGQDGKLYSATQKLNVAKGGCEG
ncbi:MAG: sulfur-oxidizing protein SoxY [Sulfurimonas sp.]|jgi:sulfur-oxidizing protein SoxY